MASIEQNLQSLITAKNDIAMAITDKGVTLSENAGFLDFANAIDSIPSSEDIEIYHNMTTKIKIDTSTNIINHYYSYFDGKILIVWGGYTGNAKNNSSPVEITIELNDLPSSFNLTEHDFNKIFIACVDSASALSYSSNKINDFGVPTAIDERTINMTGVWNGDTMPLPSKRQIMVILEITTQEESDSQ